MNVEFLYAKLSAVDGRCSYCGQPSDTIDHVFPRSVLRNLDTTNAKLMKGLRDILIKVPCCQECNMLAGYEVFSSFLSKRSYVRARLRKRYKKVLKTPEWDEEELKDLSVHLRSHIEGVLKTRIELLQRLSYKIEEIGGESTEPL